MVHKMFSDQVVDDTELRLIWLALMPLYYEKFDPDAALERTRTLQLHAETHNALFAGKNYDLRAELGTIEVPTLVVVGDLKTVEPQLKAQPELANLPVKAVNGTTIYMRDIANVHDGSAPQTNIVRSDGKRAALLTVEKTGSASTLTIIDQVKAMLATTEVGKLHCPPRLAVARHLIEVWADLK